MKIELNPLELFRSGLIFLAKTKWCHRIFEGEEVELDGKKVRVDEAFVLKSDCKVTLKNLGRVARFSVLQGRPIGESVE
ncbi:hypothetical protein ABFY09_14950 [Marinomonas sp. 5E14-1]|uniref:hypothetical protein n=1 Tax=Marinomonas sp. 5E14-1 TaxID=3153922 RepID=UPI0032665CD1